jgi:ATP-dependent Lhr-like helicase
LVELFESQLQWSDVPSDSELLIECSPSSASDELNYAFHAPLHRAACEAVGRAVSAHLGQQIGRNLTMCVADLGWSIRVPHDVDCVLVLESIRSVLSLRGFIDLVLEGLDHGELHAKRFRHIAATALMVLRNPESGRRIRVGGLNWVSTRLYPLVKLICPDHPLLRETRREVLEDILDVPAAASWLQTKPQIRFLKLPRLSPFTLAWIEPGGHEILRYEPAVNALRRLHTRLAIGT